MSGPAMKSQETLLQLSNLPASMNGNPVLYGTTLAAVMCGAVLGAYVVMWMAKDIYRDRKSVKFKSVLFNFRLMMGLAGLAAVMSCLPEVLYLQMFGDPDVSTKTQAVVMTAKRVVDSTRVFVIMGWVSVLTMIYPYVCLALIDNEQETISHLQVEDYPGWYRLVRPAVCFVAIGVAAMAFSFSKVYGH